MSIVSKEFFSGGYNGGYRKPRLKVALSLPIPWPSRVQSAAADSKNSHKRRPECNSSKSQPLNGGTGQEYA